MNFHYSSCFRIIEGDSYPWSRNRRLSSISSSLSFAS